MLLQIYSHRWQEGDESVLCKGNSFTCGRQGWVKYFIKRGDRRLAMLRRGISGSGTFWKQIFNKTLCRSQHAGEKNDDVSKETVQSRYE